MKGSISVDLLNTTSESAARRKTAMIAVFFALLVGLFATVGAAASYRAAARGTSVFAEVIDLPGIADIRRLALGSDTSLPNTPNKTDSDQINILFLGVGGAGHDGPQLSDTIILATFDRKQNRVAMLSIPRDLAYPLGNGKFEKINSLNAWQEVEHPGEGAQKTAELIGTLFNIHIDHVIRIDFDGFTKFIDALGGVDVTVEKSFTDTSYPIGEDGGWRTVSFKKGDTTMNGETTLEFARSRHGNNGEGSDFARSKRQQLIIQGVREKLFSLGTLANPKKISELINILSGHIQTDLSSWDLIAFAPLAAQIDRNNITMRVLTDAADGELVPANVNGAYMLFPKKPDWSEIRFIAANPFVSKEEVAKQLIPQINVTLEIKNGTTYEGYASQVSQKLKAQGYLVSAVGNSAHRGYERTVLYDLTNGQKTAEIVRLKNLLDADISSAMPTTVDGKQVIYGQFMTPENISATGTDILVILGESSLGVINPSYEPPKNP
ncbi:MAG: LCP family protein [Patescibacteria group bacterium]|jgi:LCP family protein required for cell wall assembly